MSQNNRTLKLARSTLGWAASACCAMSALTTTPTWAATTSCSRVDIAPVVKVALGKSSIIRPETPIQRIVVGSPASAGNTSGNPQGATASRHGAGDVDVMLLSPREVYLLGKTLGSTNVVLMDRDGTCTAFDVLVSMDALGLQTLIQELVPNEKGIKITTANDAIVLSGEVSDSEAVTRTVDLAQAFVSGSPAGTTPGGSAKPKVINMLSVAAPQQVMLEVKVAEISKTLLDEFGIDFSRAFVNGNGTSLQALSGLLGGAPLTFDKLKGTGSGVPLSSVGAVVGGTVGNGTSVAGGNITQTPVFDSSGRLLYNEYKTTFGTVPAKGVNNTRLNMQKTDGLVKVLAEPTIMAISGQTGSFLAGGKILIPVSQNNGAGGTAVTLEEKEFGVAVSFTPTVLGSGRINLHVRPEVSELNATGVTITGLSSSTVLPSFTSRKAETTVQLADGQSFAVGGLVKNNASTSITAFPFLGELPIIGALFRSSQFQTDRTELVFVITPRLVKPLPADFKLPTDGYVPPTRSDLILQGRTEGRKPTDDSTSSPTQGGFDLSAPKEKP